MLKTIFSFFWGAPSTPADNLDLEDAYNIIADADPNLAKGEEKTSSENPKAEESPVIEPPEAYEVCNRKGKITKILDEDTYVIEDLYTFQSILPDLVVGSQIAYQLIKESGEIKVCNVEFLENDWGCESVGGRKKSTWHPMTMVCQVTDRSGRSVSLTPGNLSLNLNNISSEFVPIVGDWVELDVKCETDETITDLSGKILEVDNLRPVRPQTKTGKITVWNQDLYEGLIDRNIFFNRDSLRNGYVPIKGEQVCVEIIESYQKQCSWRAVNIIPIHLQNRAKNTSTNSSENAIPETHPGVEITDELCVNFESMGQIKLLTIEIEPEMDLNLVCIYSPMRNNQCRLLTEVDHFKLQPDRPLTITCECKATSAGTSKEILIFDFDTFKIRRTITITVRGEILQDDGGKKKFYQRPVKKPFSFRENLQIIRGQQIKSGARFIPVQMPDFAVPEKLLKLMVSSDNRDTLKTNLETMKPSLTSSLTFMNYEDKFHALLHLDEIHMMIEMQNYDQDKACFVRSGEYLLLEIDNLSEKRPSVIVGDSVIAYQPGSDSKQGYAGCIHKTSKNHIYVKFAQVFHESYDGEDYSIYIRALRTTYRREHWSVNLAVKNLGKEWLFPTSTPEKEPQVEFVYDSYFDSLSPEKKDLLREPFTNKPSHNIMSHKRILGKLKKLKEMQETVRPPKLEWFNKELNFYQKEAVRNVLLGVCRPLPYIIFGPPGTGKTVTLVEVILQILRLIPHSRLLVSAPSNSAADLLAILLIDSGVVKPGDLIRLVARTYIDHIPATLAPYCCTANFEKEGTETALPVVTSSGLVEGLNSRVIGRHRVTVTTCSSAGQLYTMGFPKGHFSHIIVDEAAQTTEPNILIPLAFLDVSSGQVVMAGDPMQLGPVVLSKFSCLYGLEESLMERFVNKFPFQRDTFGFPESSGYDPRIITKLLYNYRSLPDLLRLPSQLFYNDDLIPIVSETDSEEMALLKKIEEILPTNLEGKLSSIIFHAVDGENYQAEDSPSWYNPEEASQTFYYLNELLRMGLTAADIGIITPYKAQLKQLHSLFSEADFVPPKIGTVEEFQGQEFNVIIVSTVRSSRKYIHTDVRHSLGFVASPRRLNVSITRAKSLLIIIGNPSVLIADGCWQSVINYAIQKGSYIGSQPS